MSAKILCSIIVPVFNQLEYTRECLSAISLTCSNINYEVIVVNNGSTDGTYNFLEELDKTNPLIKVFHFEFNTGYSPANNFGADQALGEYLVLLNNDTIPQPGWIEALLEVARKPDVGVTGAKLLYPTSRLINHAGYVYSRELQGFFPIYHYAAGDLPFVNKEREFQALLGACLCLKKDLYKSIGGLNNFGLEDIDFCLRIRESGKKIVYVPTSLVLHHGSVTLNNSQHGTLPQMDVKEFSDRWASDMLIDDHLVYFHEDGLGVELLNKSPVDILISDIISESYKRLSDANSLRISGQVDQAITLVEEAFYIYRYNREAAIELIIAYAEKNKKNEALSIANQYIEFMPGDSEFLSIQQSLR